MFFPILKILDLEGWTDLFNFAPNNWERGYAGKVHIYLLHPDQTDEIWHVTPMGQLQTGEHLRVTTGQIPHEALCTGMALLHPSREALPSELHLLPSGEIWNSQTPAWRSTVGVQGRKCRASYQGELEPFPEKGSLLSFHPFIQFGEIRNYLVALNLQQNPDTRPAKIEVYDSRSRSLLDVQSLRRNGATIIPLDGYGFGPEDLPVFLSRDISAVPFGLGIAKDGSMMSLEHTHPPASFFLHGDRWKQQAQTKKAWFELLVGNE